MKDLRRMARISVALGIVAVLAVGVSHLALTDIWHGEGDLTLEWCVLQIAAAVILAAQVFAIATLRSVMAKGRPSAHGH